MMEENIDSSSNNNSISNNDTAEDKDGAPSNNDEKGGDNADSPAFRLRPRRSTPRSYSTGSTRKSAPGSLIFSRLRSQQQTPAAHTTSSAKRNLFSSNEPNGTDSKESTHVGDDTNGEADNDNKRTNFKRDIIDSIATDVIISPFMQRISVVDLKPNLTYEHNYITLQVKEVITSDNSLYNTSTQSDNQDEDISSSSNNVKISQQQSKIRNPDMCSVNKGDISDESLMNDNDCSNTNLLRLICIEPKHLFDSSFSDDGDISVGSNDTNASNSSTTRRTSTRKKRRVGSLLSPYESPEPFLSKDKLINDTLFNRQSSTPMPMIVQLCGEYAKCPVKVGKLINIAKFKTVMTTDTDIKSLNSFNELIVTSAKTKFEDAILTPQKNLMISYRGSTYTCLPYHVDVRAELYDVCPKQYDTENLKSVDSLNIEGSFPWVPFVSITTFIDKPIDPLVEISSTSLDKKNTDKEIQQQKESTNQGRNLNGSNSTQHGELSQGEGSDASTDESRHKKFFYNTHNTLKQASESPDMKILLKPSSSN